VMDINPGPDPGRSTAPGTPRIADVGKAVVFSASEGIFGLELWKTDKQDTFHLIDLAPGAGSSAPEHFVLMKKLLFFTADDNTTGRELYVMQADVAHLPKPAVQNLSDKFKEKKYSLGHGHDMEELLALLADHNLLDIEIEPDEIH
jgi:ELWxxDGT repeat protein